MSFLFGVISGAYSTGTGGGTGGGGGTPTCTPTCGSWSYTYGSWSSWSACSGGTQTRTRTVSGSRTCTASDCSTYTETSSTTETESQSCTPTTTWYCTTIGGGHYTSSTDDSSICSVYCSTTGFPGSVPC